MLAQLDVIAVELQRLEEYWGIYGMISIVHQVTSIATYVPLSLCYRGIIQSGKNKATVEGLVLVWLIAVAYLPCHCCHC